MSEQSIFGYYDHPTQEKPSFDPGLNVLCPFCLIQLSEPLKTISLTTASSTKSYFYRAHKHCYESADDTEIGRIEGSQIDSSVKETPDD